MTETFHKFIFPVCCWYCLTNVENIEMEKALLSFFGGSENLYRRSVYSSVVRLNVYFNTGFLQVFVEWP